MITFRDVCHKKKRKSGNTSINELKNRCFISIEREARQVRWIIKVIASTTWLKGVINVKS